MPMPIGVRFEADRLHDLGWWLVPTDGKKPLRAGYNDRRLDKAELTAHLTPGRGMAVVLGRSGLIDLECDEPAAEGELLALFGGTAPRTPTYRARRGRHRLFRRPPRLPDDAKAKGYIGTIEVRAGGPQVAALSMLPPSPHPDGGRYNWESMLSVRDVPPAELPDELAERLMTVLGRDTPAPANGPVGPNDPIPEGRRSDELFRSACDLARLTGMSQEAVVAALQVTNRIRCRPPLPAAEVTSIARSAWKTVRSAGPAKGGLGKSADRTTADLLVEMAEAAGVGLWHTPDGTGYATIPASDHAEHVPVRSKWLKDWLAREYHARRGKVPSSLAVGDALGVLDGRARFGGKEHPVHIRVAGHDGRIYLDLGGPDWTVAEVDAAGWRMIPAADAPVRFRRRKGMRPLPAPEPGGAVADLWRFLNVDEADRPLVLAWLVAAFRPTGPYPVLRSEAEHGSGKTTASRVLRGLVDPNDAPVRSAPRSARDLMIATNNGWMVAFDNMSYIDGDLSDALCRLATGGGFATRTLYTDDEETIFDACRPILLNGIGAVGLRPDLMDRTLVVRLPRIEAKDRRPEAVFWVGFEAARPKLLGAFLTAVSAALRDLPEVQVRTDVEWPRMADFAQWATAAEPALGLGSGACLTAYEANRTAAADDLLDTNPAVASLVRLLERAGRFEGTASQLLMKLEIGQDTRRSGWPGNARALSAILTRFAPPLRLAGWSVEQGRDGNNKVWRIERALDAPPLTEGRPTDSGQRYAKLNAKLSASASSQRPQKSGHVPPKPRRRTKRT